MDTWKTAFGGLSLVLVAETRGGMAQSEDDDGGSAEIEVRTDPLAEARETFAEALCRLPTRSSSVRGVLAAIERERDERSFEHLLPREVDVDKTRSKDELVGVLVDVYEGLKGARDERKDRARQPLKDYEDARMQLARWSETEQLNEDAIMMDEDGSPAGELYCDILSCTNVAVADTSDSSFDPYIVIHFDGQPVAAQTSVQSGLAPVWNEQFVIHPLVKRGGVLSFYLYDQDAILNDELHFETHLNLHGSDLFPEAALLEGTVLALDMDSAEDETNTCTLNIRVRACYSKVAFYLDQLKRLQHEKDSIIKAVIHAESMLSTFFGPFQRLQMMHRRLLLEENPLVLPTPTQDKLEEDHVWQFPAAHWSERWFFVSSFFGTVVLMLLMDSLPLGTNPYAEILPGEP